jgi:hypothetical protein
MHVAAVITVMGVLLGTQAFPATADGYAALLDWARGHGRLRRAGIEGTSSHGTALNRYLRRHDLQILEVNRSDRARRRRHGKTDAVDAENAVRAELSQQATAIAKTGDGAVEMIRMLKVARDSAIKARTQATNQLRAVLMRADPALTGHYTRQRGDRRVVGSVDIRQDTHTSAPRALVSTEPGGPACYRPSTST